MRTIALGAVLAIAAFSYLPIQHAEAKTFWTYYCGFGICFDDDFAMLEMTIIIVVASFGLIVYGKIQRIHNAENGWEIRLSKNLMLFVITSLPMLIGLYGMFKPTAWPGYLPSPPFPFATDTTYHADLMLTYTYVGNNPDPIQVALMNPYWLVWSLLLYFGIAAIAAFAFARLKASKPTMRVA